MLDKNIGGSFDIDVDSSYVITQSYLKNTAVLRTHFSNGMDAFEILDFMPRYKTDTGSSYNPPDIIRYFNLLSGKPTFTINYDPKLEYARNPTATIIEDSYIKSYTSEGEYDSLYLYSSFSQQKIVDKQAHTLTTDGFVLISYNQKLISQTTDVITSYSIHYTKLYEFRTLYFNY